MLSWFKGGGTAPTGPAAGYERAATHAGSWYDRDGPALRRSLRRMLAAANEQGAAARAVIAPHAGYSYSGPVAGHAYARVPSTAKRVFVLGPSHHVPLRGCAITRASSLATPLGALRCCSRTLAALEGTGHFQVVSREVDEAEHSIEMHLPYIHATCNSAGHPVDVVPVIVGTLDGAAADVFAEVLKGYLDDPEVFFVVSSDFCHWGSRFGYQPTAAASAEPRPIHEYIEALDRQGMSLIEAGEPGAFATYLATTRNTICGKNPIVLLLHTMRAATASLSVEFVKYAQSSAVRDVGESSVSYAAAVVTITGR